MVDSSPHTADMDLQNGGQRRMGSASQAVQRFFLVGSERSGSTMLRLMLDHHPAITCMYESDFLVAHYQRCRDAPPGRYAWLLEKDWHFVHSGLRFPRGAGSYREVVEEFFRQRSQATGKTIVGATIHRDFHQLPKLAPGARYVHLLRDVRPVASSMVKMCWAGNLFGGALQWRNTITQIQVLQQAVPADQWLEVKYEDLVADPPGKLGQICAFLGVSYSDQMLRYHEQSTYDPPDPANARRWQSRLSPREIYLAEMAAGDALEGAGYARMFPPVRASQLERLAILAHNRIRRSRLRCRRYGTYLIVARRLWRLLGIRRPSLERRYEAISEAHIR